MGIQVHNQVGGRLGAAPGRKGHKRLMSEINVTPFVDVMLVLLVIFMATAPLMTAGIEVALPEEDTAPLAGQDEPLTVSINKNGTIFLQEASIDIDSLMPKLEAITQRNKDARIFVRADKTIDYGKVMQVMTAITQAGFKEVGLVTEQPGSK